MDKKDRVAVVMGGPSKEREVSLNTGNAILNALKEKGYDAVAIDLDPEHIVDQLKASGARVVFNAVHGLYGEDGRLQGILEMLGDYRAKASYSIKISDILPEITGKFWIKSDSHTFENGTHTMKLEIEFENLMDKQELSDGERKV